MSSVEQATRLKKWNWYASKPLDECESTFGSWKSAAKFVRFDYNFGIEGEKENPFRSRILLPSYEYEIIKVEGEDFEVNVRLREIRDEIIKSQQILELGEDWDDNGAFPCNRKSYLNSINLLLSYSNLIARDLDLIIKAPEINLVRDGSIDLEWRSANEYLLINILNKDQFEAHYYGEDYSSSTVIKGFLNSLDINEDLKFWMRKLA